MDVPAVAQQVPFAGMRAFQQDLGARLYADAAALERARAAEGAELGEPCEDENSERIAELHTALSHSLTHGATTCAWCTKELAGPDGFCSRMCRVESWKANGDDSDFLSEDQAEILAWGRAMASVQQEDDGDE